MFATQPQPASTAGSWMDYLQLDSPTAAVNSHINATNGAPLPSNPGQSPHSGSLDMGMFGFAMQPQFPKVEQQPSQASAINSPTTLSRGLTTGYEGMIGSPVTAYGIATPPAVNSNLTQQSSLANINNTSNVGTPDLSSAEPTMPNIQSMASNPSISAASSPIVSSLGFQLAHSHIDHSSPQMQLSLAFRHPSLSNSASNPYYYNGTNPSTSAHGQNTFDFNPSEFGMPLNEIQSPANGGNNSNNTSAANSPQITANASPGSVFDSFAHPAMQFHFDLADPLSMTSCPSPFSTTSALSAMAFNSDAFAMSEFGFGLAPSINSNPHQSPQQQQMILEHAGLGHPQTNRALYQKRRFSSVPGLYTMKPPTGADVTVAAAVAGAVLNSGGAGKVVKTRPRSKSHNSHAHGPSHLSSELTMSLDGQSPFSLVSSESNPSLNMDPKYPYSFISDGSIDKTLPFMSAQPSKMNPTLIDPMLMMATSASSPDLPSFGLIPSMMMPFCEGKTSPAMQYQQLQQQGKSFTHSMSQPSPDIGATANNQKLSTYKSAGQTGAAASRVQGATKISKGDQTSWKCSCDQVFDDWAQFQLHSKTHKAEKCHICEHCNRGFTRRQDLKRHKLTHFQLIKPFQCTQCGTTFTRNDALQRHLKAKRCG
ncbi:hypothetical protein O5D80_008399 [Batrachochytrium dendrobatidis]|nr:hypothetical protein O5D80_008399 [Batrachochytrium dendrobatidis]